MGDHLMNGRYPHFKGHTPAGLHILRDGLVLNFFIQRSHREIGDSIARALEIYRRSVGVEKLGLYTGEEGYILPLDPWASTYIQQQLSDWDGCVIQLWEHDDQWSGYRFDYRGQMLGTDTYTRSPDAVCCASFWLPTEYLEEQGPARVKELAMALARELPLTSGYANLAFNGMMDTFRVGPLIHDLCFRYPGLDIVDDNVTFELGTRPKGAYWLNFYGQPLLDKLGGVEGLRERLTLPGISVEPLQPDKVLVQLGEWPEADGEMRAYRQLARVLEPYLYQETRPVLPPEDMRRWERRFLD
jgi:hypothetical protein